MQILFGDSDPFLNMPHIHVATTKPLLQPSFFFLRLTVELLVFLDQIETDYNQSHSTDNKDIREYFEYHKGGREDIPMMHLKTEHAPFAAVNR